MNMLQEMKTRFIDLTDKVAQGEITDREQIKAIDQLELTIDEMEAHEEEHLECGICGLSFNYNRVDLPHGWEYTCDC